MSDIAPAKWTDARQNALEAVAAGTVTMTWPLKGKPSFMVAGYWQKPRQAPYVWLSENGFIRLDAPSLRGTPVVLTTTGKTRMTDHGDNSGMSEDLNWTRLREDTLRAVAYGAVSQHSPLRPGSTFFVLAPWVRPTQGPYLWLLEHGFIQIPNPSISGSDVTLTDTGREHLNPAKNSWDATKTQKLRDANASLHRARRN